MKRAINCMALAAGLFGTAFNTVAQTPIAECPKGYAAAQVDISAIVSTNAEGCPLLEEKELRKLVDRYLTGSVFAHPLVPGTCLSGVITEGSVTMEGAQTAVVGRTESAQRFFPEAAAVNPGRGGLLLLGLSEDGTQFMAGAAATVVTLQGADSDLNFRLVLDDRFSVSLSDGFPFADTEDFNVVGAEGVSARGRLTGTAYLYSPIPPIVDAAFTVEGSICLK